MTTQVMHTITDPESAPISGAQVIVDVYPDGPGYVNTLTDTIVAPKKRKSDANGLVTFDLVGNADIIPAGTVYRVRDYPAKDVIRTHYIDVPAAGGPYWLGDLLSDPPGTLESAALTVHANLPAADGHLDHDNVWTALTEFDEEVVIELPAAAANQLKSFKVVNGVSATTIFQVARRQSVNANRIGLFGATPVPQQTVAGSRADPEQALKSLLDALASMGVVIDSSTP